VHHKTVNQAYRLDAFHVMSLAGVERKELQVTAEGTCITTAECFMLV